jgi:hypothetical protein
MLAGSRPILPVNRGRRAPFAVLAMLLAVAACGGYSGPPDIEVARQGIVPEYHIEYAGADGKTVLELLREHADTVVTEGTGDDLLVTSINGIEGGFEGRYWLYYVNEQAGLIAASRMTTVEGDSIEWFFVR